MELNTYQQQAFNHQRAEIEKFGKLNWFFVIFFLCWIGAGAYALYLQIAKGHGVTGMRDNVVWGLFIVNFIFFIGLSYAGAIIAGLFCRLIPRWVAHTATIAGVAIAFIASCTAGSIIRGSTFSNGPRF